MDQKPSVYGEWADSQPNMVLKTIAQAEGYTSINDPALRTELATEPQPTIEKVDPAASITQMLGDLGF